MKKRIIVCCDGTWNEPESIKDEHKVPQCLEDDPRRAAAR